ncbi:RHS repeat-associated core domain-containing protein [Streptomyces sp. SCSIO 30461]|uniref:RHS repeat domain-containing protein n=1 Tax=Streptomyces sp. SCSIO 30461 TaxID=3118085 RepID=UPI0030CFB731
MLYGNKARPRSGPCTRLTYGLGVPTSNRSRRAGAAIMFSRRQGVPRQGPEGLTWNDEGKLATSTASGSTTSFLYDPDGTRLLKREPTKTTLYLPGGQELILTKSTGTLAGNRYYSVPGGSAIRSSDGQVRFLVADHHGTNTLSITASNLAVNRRKQLPYGAERGTPPAFWPGQKGFVGGDIDTTTGLTHIGAREYDTKLGQFISVDPILSLDQPQSLNGYNYANNNPVTKSDPTGLREVCSAYGNSCTPAAPGPTDSNICYANCGGSSGAGGSGGSGGTNGTVSTSNDGQPVIDGIRMPKFNELSNYAAAYKSQDTYGYRLESWAKNQCFGRNGSSSGYTAFCGTAQRAGLLEVGDDPFGVKVIGRCVTSGENCGEAAVTAALYLVGAGLEWAAARSAGASAGSAVAGRTAVVHQGPADTVQIFRNVDATEFDAIATTGRFGTGEGQMEGKWFATEGGHADRWGELLNRGDGLTVTTRIPKSLADQLHHHAGKLDGVGPGYYADGDQLAQINKQMSGIELWP